MVGDTPAGKRALPACFCHSGIALVVVPGCCLGFVDGREWRKILQPSLLPLKHPEITSDPRICFYGAPSSMITLFKAFIGCIFMCVCVCV